MRASRQVLLLCAMALGLQNSDLSSENINETSPESLISVNNKASYHYGHRRRTRYSPQEEFESNAIEREYGGDVEREHSSSSDYRMADAYRYGSERYDSERGREGHYSSRREGEYDYQRNSEDMIGLRQETELERSRSTVAVKDKEIDALLASSQEERQEIRELEHSLSKERIIAQEAKDRARRNELARLAALREEKETLTQVKQLEKDLDRQRLLVSKLEKQVSMEQVENESLNIRLQREQNKVSQLSEALKEMSERHEKQILSRKSMPVETERPSRTDTVIEKNNAEIEKLSKEVHALEEERRRIAKRTKRVESRPLSAQKRALEDTEALGEEVKKDTLMKKVKSNDEIRLTAESQRASGKNGTETDKVEASSGTNDDNNDDKWLQSMKPALYVVGGIGIGSCMLGAVFSCYYFTSQKKKLTKVYK